LPDINFADDEDARLLQKNAYLMSPTKVKGMAQRTPNPERMGMIKAST
jgi:hypothetical protein